jgi:hypothetical protein
MSKHNNLIICYGHLENLEETILRNQTIVDKG